MVLMDVLIAQETQMGIELVECAISLNALKSEVMPWSPVLV
jgi:hypothetical protein